MSGGEEDPGSGRRPPPEAQERAGMVRDRDPRTGSGRRRSPGPARARGAAGGRSRSGGRRRGDTEEPSRVGGLLAALFEKMGIADRVGRAAAATRWQEVVGPEIARRTGDVRVRGRALVVEVESSSWMQELDMQRHHIRRKINEELPEEGQIEKIVFVQEGND